MFGDFQSLKPNPDEHRIQPIEASHLAFTEALTTSGEVISTNGRSAWHDNVFVERLWRTIKYLEVYLRAYYSVSDARQHLRRYIEFCNARRSHSSLGAMTPDESYFATLPAIQ